MNIIEVLNVKDNKVNTLDAQTLSKLEELLNHPEKPKRGQTVESLCRMSLPEQGAIPPALTTVCSPARPKEGFKITGQIVCIGLGMGLLSAIFLPCFIGAPKKALTASIKGNMRTVQIAAESYATDHLAYPNSLAQLKPYLPGGARNAGASQDSFLLPANPVAVASSGVVDGPGFVSDMSIGELRARSVGKSFLEPGQVGYCNVNNGKSYAVIGADPKGGEVSGIGGNVLVLSCM